MGWVANATACLLYPPPRKRPGTHCLGGWVDPRAVLDGCGKFCPPPPPGLVPPPLKPLPGRYTNQAIPFPNFPLIPN